MLGDLERSGQLGPAEAVTAEAQQAVVSAVEGYVASLWQRYASEYEARPDAPRVVIRFADQQTVGGWTKARASVRHHVIRLDHRACRRAWILHEVAHLLVPNTGHGPQWVGAMTRLWQCEFGISVEQSSGIAADMGLAVNQHMPERPTLRTRFNRPCSCCA